ncbi:MAG: 4-hydroxy-3-methylbut-2-enyl diphosphate reductase [Firmicutes bacterium]|nr:4-hydroxy-3-methylbut-2-enyl diphosphate reductase [Bacillota bacterium]
MNLIISKYIGFCCGVSLAVDEILKNVDTEIKILEKIAHNEILIKMLKTRKNIKFIRDVNEATQGDTVVIRTHGIKEQDFKKLIENKINIIDKTCPNVKLIHLLAQKFNIENKQFVLLGDKNHPEVISIVSRCKNTIVVDSINSAKNLISSVEFKKIYVASQTTFDIQKYCEICEFLKKKIKDIKFYRTICKDALNRQKELIKIASKVDLIIIVGSKISSNSTKLFEIAKKSGKEAVMVNESKDLNFELLKNKDTVFISSGASVMKETVYKLIDEIRHLS